MGSVFSLSCPWCVVWCIEKIFDSSIRVAILPILPMVPMLPTETFHDRCIFFLIGSP